MTTSITIDDLEPILDGGETIGWRVKSTDRHHIDVMTMAFNYRLVTTCRDMPGCYDRYWCYAGKAFPVLLTAIAAAYAWTGDDDTEPLGWAKNGQTKEWRGPQ